MFGVHDPKWRLGMFAGLFVLLIAVPVADHYLGWSARFGAPGQWTGAPAIPEADLRDFDPGDFFAAGAYPTGAVRCEDLPQRSRRESAVGLHGSERAAARALAELSGTSTGAYDAVRLGAVLVFSRTSTPVEARLGLARVGQFDVSARCAGDEEARALADALQHDLPARFGATGEIEREGDRVLLGRVAFHEARAGIIALVVRLCASGCSRDVRVGAVAGVEGPGALAR